MNLCLIPVLRFKFHWQAYKDGLMAGSNETTYSIKYDNRPHNWGNMCLMNFGNNILSGQ